MNPLLCLVLLSLSTFSCFGVRAKRAVTLSPKLQRQKQNDLNQSLIKASKKGKTETIERLLLNGASGAAQDGQGSALHWAALRGHTDAVRALLDHGTSANIFGKGGTTPLAWMVDNTDKKFRPSHTAIAALLIRNGSVINGLFDHQSNVKQIVDRFPSIICEKLAQLAVAEKTDELKKILPTLPRYIVNKQDGVGMTALHWAATYGQEASMRMLLSHDAIDSLVDNKKKTAWDILRENNKHDIISNISEPYIFWALSNPQLVESLDQTRIEHKVEALPPEIVLMIMGYIFPHKKLYSNHDKPLQASA
jgi:ankyrin repeat protein